MHFKERLRTLRIVHRLTGKEVALALGISASTYRSYEIGRREPGFDTLKKLVDFYQVSADYLLGITDIAPESSTCVIAKRYGLSPIETLILRFFVSLPERERNQFIDGIKHVKNNDVAIFEEHLATALQTETKHHKVSKRIKKIFLDSEKE